MFSSGVFSGASICVAFSEQSLPPAKDDFTYLSSLSDDVEERNHFYVCSKGNVLTLLGAYQIVKRMQIDYDGNFIETSGELTDVLEGEEDLNIDLVKEQEVFNELKALFEYFYSKHTEVIMCFIVGVISDKNDPDNGHCIFTFYSQEDKELQGLAKTALEVKEASVWDMDS
jgi:hypothetical protein